MDDESVFKEDWAPPEDLPAPTVTLCKVGSRYGFGSKSGAILIFFKSG